MALFCVNSPLILELRLSMLKKGVGYRFCFALLEVGFILHDYMWFTSLEHVSNVQIGLGENIEAAGYFMSVSD